METAKYFTQRTPLKLRFGALALLIICALSSPFLKAAEEPSSQELLQNPLSEEKELAETQKEATSQVIATPSGNAPYTLPWQLRSIIPGHGARLDSAFAFYDDKNGNSGGVAIASTVSGSYKILPEFAVLLKLGFVNNNPPANAPSAISFVNPLVGGLYSFKLSDDFRLGFFLGMTAPLGMGGGNSPDPATQSANSAGILARSAMDNALFAVNYFTVIPGVDLAYIAHGFTFQIEATVLQLTRVRGEQVDKDPARTNFTSGLEVGYAFTPYISIESELRYQRWLENQTVAASASPATENLSFAVGPRFQFKAGDLTMKPGIAYAQGISGPMARGGYTYPTNSDKIIFFDFPMSF
jgi:hypothetical protein